MGEAHAPRTRQERRGPRAVAHAGGWLGQRQRRRVASAVLYQKKNLAAKLCQSCPKPLAPNSLRYCEKHLTMQRLRHRPKSGPEPGTREWLYEDEGIEKRRGRSPGNLARLAMEREKHTRALLAELGIAPENAAISLEAAKEAIPKHAPASRQEALCAEALFAKAGLITKTTGYKALKSLLAEGKIQRKGKGTRGSPYRYFAGSAENLPQVLISPAE